MLTITRLLKLYAPCVEQRKVSIYLLNYNIYIVIDNNKKIESINNLLLAIIYFYLHICKIKIKKKDVMDPFGTNLISKDSE